LPAGCFSYGDFRAARRLSTLMGSEIRAPMAIVILCGLCAPEVASSTLAAIVSVGHQKGREQRD